MRCFRGRCEIWTRFKAGPEHTEYVPFFDEAVGDIWRAQLPRLNAAAARLRRARLAFSSSFSSGGEMAASGEASVTSLVRSFCAEQGLDSQNIAMRIAAMNALTKMFEGQQQS